VSPLEGIRRRVGPNVAVYQATNNDDSDALRLARSCDVCIVCVGNHPTGDGPWAEVTRASYGREAVDRRSIELEDEKLVRDVIEANPRTIVVLVANFPYAIEWTKEHAPAIVLATHNSQELGTALADVLFGDANPAGRLVQTWPRVLQDLPPLLDYDIRRGRTHLYATAEPLWPFGFGLSYTSFAYRGLTTSADRLDANGAITVSVELENTGDRAGDEVVQLYVRRSDRTAQEPIHRLGAFRRVALRPGETRAVDLTLRARDLAAWNPPARRFEVRAGEVEIVVGGSSAHAALRRRVRID
jgi:beta-glucosidase